MVALIGLGFGDLDVATFVHSSPIFLISITGCKRKLLQQVWDFDYLNSSSYDRPSGINKICVKVITKYLIQGNIHS